MDICKQELKLKFQFFKLVFLNSHRQLNNVIVTWKKERIFRRLARCCSTYLNSIASIQAINDGELLKKIIQLFLEKLTLKEELWRHELVCNLFEWVTKKNLKYRVDCQLRLGRSIPFFVLVDPYPFYCIKKVWID